jgi:hypothetical protein
LVDVLNRDSIGPNEIQKERSLVRDCSIVAFTLHRESSIDCKSDERRSILSTPKVDGMIDVSRDRAALAISGGSASLTPSETLTQALQSTGIPCRPSDVWI